MTATVHHLSTPESIAEAVRALVARAVVSHFESLTDEAVLTMLKAPLQDYLQEEADAA